MNVLYRIHGDVTMLTRQTLLKFGVPCLSVVPLVAKTTPTLASLTGHTGAKRETIYA